MCRAWRLVSPLACSAKVTLGQAGTRQKNRRTVRQIGTPSRTLRVRVSSMLDAVQLLPLASAHGVFGVSQLAAVDLVGSGLLKDPAEVHACLLQHPAGSQVHGHCLRDYTPGAQLGETLLDQCA